MKTRGALGTLAILSAEAAAASSSRSPLPGQHRRPPNRRRRSPPVRRASRRLRIATVSGDDSYSSHPAETRFSSTPYARLHQVPLFGADPREERIDASLWRGRILGVPAGSHGAAAEDSPGTDLQQRRADHGGGRGVLGGACRQQVCRFPAFGHAAGDRRQRQADRRQDRRDQFHQGLADFRPRGVAAGVPGLRDIEGLPFRRRDIASSLRQVPRQSARRRPISGRRAPGASVRDAGGGAQGSAARLPALRPHRDPQRVGDRYPNEPVPHRAAGHHLGQPRSRRPGQEEWRDRFQPARREHHRLLYFPHRPAGECLPQGGRSQGGRLRHRPQAAGRDDLG